MTKITRSTKRADRVVHELDNGDTVHEHDGGDVWLYTGGILTTAQHCTSLAEAVKRSGD